MQWWNAADENLNARPNATLWFKIKLSKEEPEEKKNGYIAPKAQRIKKRKVVKIKTSRTSGIHTHTKSITAIVQHKIHTSAWCTCARRIVQNDGSDFVDNNEILGERNIIISNNGNHIACMHVNKPANMVSMQRILL